MHVAIDEAWPHLAMIEIYVFAGRGAAGRGDRHNPTATDPQIDQA
jgi:hypothetical protein